jgi:hypothetical protein
MSAPHSIPLPVPSLSRRSNELDYSEIWPPCRPFDFEMEFRAFGLNVAYSGRCGLVVDFSQTSCILTKFTSILLPIANATQPPSRHSPPNGVIGPSTLNLCGSSTSKYMLPLNIVMPATKREEAILLLGATDVARRRTPEWIS